VQAEDPGDELATVTLDRFLREAVEDWAPVAESSETKLVLQEESACPVRFEPCRLQQALFHLLEFLMGSAGQGGAIQATLRAENSEAVLALDVECGRKKEPEAEESEKEKNLKELKRQLSLAIAQRMFAAASAVWRTESHDQKFEIELRLPLATR